MVEIDAFLPEQFDDLLHGRLVAVDLVVGRVVLEAGSGHDEIRVGDVAITFFILVAAVVDDLFEKDLHGARPGMQKNS